MCVLWILLQLAVVFMYWDLPPTVRGKQTSTVKSRVVENDRGLADDEEEEDAEEKPLIASNELTGSYGSVETPNLHRNHTSAASDATENQISPPPSPEPAESHESSSPFKNFSMSRGIILFWGWQVVTAFSMCLVF